MTYFPAYNGVSQSIVSALQSVGADSSFAYRAQIAEANGISGYTGTAAQNTTMLDLLSAGSLIVPETTTTPSNQSTTTATTTNFNNNSNMTLTDSTKKTLTIAALAVGVGLVGYAVYKQASKDGPGAGLRADNQTKALNGVGRKRGSKKRKTSKRKPAKRRKASVKVISLK